MKPRLLDLALLFEFGEPEPLPILSPGETVPLTPIQATSDGKIYTLEILPGDPLYDQIVPGGVRGYGDPSITWDDLDDTDEGAPR
jgi:hypothetical protein